MSGPPAPVPADEPYEPPVPVVPLSRAFAARGGAPVISLVAPSIFTLRYFERCMGCSFCRDHCCDGGVSVDLANVERIRAASAGVARFTVGRPEQWFEEGTLTVEPDFPGGRCIDTLVVAGACALRSKAGRGCGIHAHAIEEGLDYHELKPLYCSLFPLSCDYGHLVPSWHLLEEGGLRCAGEGPSLYRGVRGELLHYFGAELVAELDALERATLG